MERTAFDPSPADTDATDRRGLAGPLDTDHVALNRYRVPPGDGLPGGLHAHADQEEVFLVLDGRATFELLDAPVGCDIVTEPRTGCELTVGAGEVVRFAPGEYQSGANHGTEPLVALAVGAPRETTDVRVPVRCSDCAAADFALDTGDDHSFVCPACGAERVPAPCPDCGSDDLTLGLGDAGVVVSCEGCRATFDTPPYE